MTKERPEEGQKRIIRTGSSTVILPPAEATRLVLGDVSAERAAQDERWGEQNHPDGTGGLHHVLAADDIRRRVQQAAAEGRQRWANVLGEEVAEAFAEDDPAKLRAELVQVAAVAVAWAEAIDRRQAPADTASEDARP